MILSFGTVMAEQVNEGDYVVTYQAEEITDMNILLDMAIEQSANKARGCAAYNEIENQLQVTHY